MRKAQAEPDLRRFAVRIAGLMLLLFPLLAHSEALILIGGYMSSTNDWQNAGITKRLEAAGWRTGGILRLHQPNKLRSVTGPAYYMVELDSDAPLLYQLKELESHMTLIRLRHQDESLILVGHSAGGVLARLFMVQHPKAGVGALITLASPHLGTESAEAGLAAGQSPLGWVGDMLGVDTLKRSAPLYADLVRERPGSLLFWLNRQPHPEARYISVVRDGRRSLLGDLIVPEWSQDMNRVAALHGRAVSISSAGNHGLDSEDGRLLVNLLTRLHGS